MNKIIFSLFVFLFQTSLTAQLLTEIPNTGNFKPEIEQITSPIYGIQLYNQYGVMQETPKIRSTSNDNLLNGTLKDTYSSGQMLHKGNYKNGIVENFINYFPNGEIERKYKSKGTGKGEIQIFYNNGNTRLEQKIQNYLAIETTAYNEDQVVVKHEIYDKNSLRPIEMKSFHNNGKMKSLIEPKSEENKTYDYTNYSNLGKIITVGEMTYNEDSAKILKTGNWITFNENNRIAIDVQYENGVVTKINQGVELIQKDSSFPLTNTLTAEVASVNKLKEESLIKAKSTIKTASTLDSRIARFDKDNNNNITVAELHGAINDFFDDESIELSQIDFLINFFFDQD